MQKKLIVVAIAAALSAPAVALADSANVTVYGAANMSADLVSTGDTTAGAKGVSKLVVSSNQTYVGLKGSEDLGGGMAAVWQIEQVVQLDNTGASGAGLATRNSFLGLKSNMGTVLMGKHDTPYKMSTRKLDVFADGLADNRALMGGVSGVSAGASFDGRQPDVLAYVSPTFSNITAVIARVNLSEGRTVAGAVDTADAAGLPTGTSEAYALSMAAMYGAGPIYASLAYESHNFKGAAPAGTTHNENAMKLGFGYTQDKFSVGAAVETTKDDFGSGTDPKGNAVGHTSIYVGGKFNLGSGAVKAAYTTAGKLGSNSDTEASQISIGYDHELSKRTTLYASYTVLSTGKAIKYNLATTSSAGATSSTGTGADPSALSFGMKHSF